MSMVIATVSTSMEHVSAKARYACRKSELARCTFAEQSIAEGEIAVAHCQNYNKLHYSKSEFCKAVFRHVVTSQ